MNSGDNNSAIGILTLGVSGDRVIVNQSQVNQTTLIGIHRSHGNTSLLASPACSCLGKTLNLRLPAGFIALDIDDDGVIELKRAAHQR